VIVPITTGTRLTVIERRTVPVPTASVASSKLVLLAATASRAGLVVAR
jgi:hypothetical protein